MKVRAKTHIYEKNKLYCPGDEMDLDPDRVRAFGDLVEPVEVTDKVENRMVTKKSKVKVK